MHVEPHPVGQHISPGAQRSGQIGQALELSPPTSRLAGHRVSYTK